MRRRRTADEITRLLKEADRDLAKGLTVSDVCRKHGIGQSMYYRWRQKLDPAKAILIAGAVSWSSRSIGLRSWSLSSSWTRRCSRTLLKKSGDPGPTASRRRLLERALRDLATADLSCLGAISYGATVPPEPPRRRTGIESSDQTAGPSASAVWIPDDSCPTPATRVDNQRQTRAETLDRAGAEAACEATKSPEIRPETGYQRQ